MLTEKYYRGVLRICNGYDYNNNCCNGNFDVVNSYRYLIYIFHLLHGKKPLIV